MTALFDKAGIQVKASKVEFGVEEITFHNYRIFDGDGPMDNTTTPKDETLNPKSTAPMKGGAHAPTNTLAMLRPTKMKASISY